MNKKIDLRVYPYRGILSEIAKEMGRKTESVHRSLFGLKNGPEPAIARIFTDKVEQRERDMAKFCSKVKDNIKIPGIKKDVSVKECAKILGVSARSVHKSIKLGRYKNAYQVLGNGGIQWRIPASDVGVVKYPRAFKKMSLVDGDGNRLNQ